MVAVAGVVAIAIAPMRRRIYSQARRLGLASARCWHTCTIAIMSVLNACRGSPANCLLWVISQGAIANNFRRMGKGMSAATTAIRDTLLSARIIASDEVDMPT